MSTLTLQDYVIAGYPAIHYKTSEEWRALEECYNIARRTRSVFKCWSETKGFHTPNEKGEANHLTPDAVLYEGLKLSTSDEPVILCLLDFHPYMKNPRVIRKARDVFVEAKSKNITYIFVSAEFDIPTELKHEIFVFDMELPTLDEYKKCIRDVIEFNNFRNITEEEIEKASNALTGLTFDEAEKAISISLSSDGKIDLEILYGIKKQIINEDNLLEYYKAEETLENVGGLENFKNYARERSFSAFSEEAKEYGLPYPKGVLLFGVPGCGKSLVAKALSNMFHVPLIKFDLGKLFGSYVGETEKNTRKALKIAESMAPCVLWMDEIDKGLSGTGSSGKNDSGVTSRMFGTILTWLQEKESPIYVIATANSINMPPELLRKGRFDEIFFVDLPKQSERKDIFKIQIKKHKRNPEDFDIESLAEKSHGYNGAEIEECIVSAMFHAWNDGKRPYTTEDIVEAMDKLTPASNGIMKESIEHLRKWSEEHCIRNANAPEFEKVQNVDELKLPQRSIRRIS